MAHAEGFDLEYEHLEYEHLVSPWVVCQESDRSCCVDVDGVPVRVYWAAPSKHIEQVWMRQCAIAMARKERLPSLDLPVYLAWSGVYGQETLRGFVADAGPREKWTDCLIEGRALSRNQRAWADPIKSILGCLRTPMKSPAVELILLDKAMTDKNYGNEIRKMAAQYLTNPLSELNFSHVANDALGSPIALFKGLWDTAKICSFELDQGEHFFKVNFDFLPSLNEVIVFPASPCDEFDEIAALSWSEQAKAQGLLPENARLQMLVMSRYLQGLSQPLSESNLINAPVEIKDHE